MAIKITEDCINCGACEAECPNNAIYEPDQYWRLSDGTSLTDSVELLNKSDNSLLNIIERFSLDLSDLILERISCQCSIS